MKKISTFLWFDKEAADAAKFYTSVFKDSKIINSTTLENTPSGTVAIITIELFGQEYRLMSAGPLFKFNESISFVINCDNQEEIDYYWEKLSADANSEQCGWLKDKFGVSWQVVPTILQEMQQTNDKNRLARVTEAFLKMKKFDIAKLTKVFNG
jgi:predicted 3-demethylubiquinone-9 3-methyltransferase (glyoxalase superfamily)